MALVKAMATPKAKLDCPAGLNHVPAEVAVVQTTLDKGTTALDAPLGNVTVQLDAVPGLTSTEVVPPTPW